MILGFLKPLRLYSSYVSRKLQKCQHLHLKENLLKSLWGFWEEVRNLQCHSLHKLQIFYILIYLNSISRTQWETNSLMTLTIVVHCFIRLKAYFCQVWWHMPIILAIQEAEVGG
jgi:hypothetical protein